MSNDIHGNDNDSQSLSSPPTHGYLDSPLGVNKTPSISSPKQPKAKEKTEILYGEQAPMDGITQAMFNVKNKASAVTLKRPHTLVNLKKRCYCYLSTSK